MTYYQRYSHSYNFCYEIQSTIFEAEYISQCDKIYMYIILGNVLCRLLKLRPTHNLAITHGLKRVFIWKVFTKDL